MVLYHAISSYQIMMVAEHFLKKNKNKYGVLILPDFITDKYKSYKNILSVFDEVYLFPYTKIPHDKNTVIKNVQKAYLTTVPYGLECFEQVYVAGAHFYFSLLLIEYQKKFNVFEDACGMIKQNHRLYNNLHNTYPIHAEIMQERGMFDFSNKLINKIYCDKKKNDFLFPSFKIRNWDTIKVFSKLNKSQQRKIISFFSDADINYDLKDKFFLITQNFIGLGNMNVNQQKEVYSELKNKLPKHCQIVVKVHPDDKFNYSDIFNDAIIFKEKIPVEILLEYSEGKPKFIFSFSSSSNIDKKRYNYYNLSERYKYLYDFNDEYKSILTIFKLKESLL